MYIKCTSGSDFTLHFINEDPALRLTLFGGPLSSKYRCIDNGAKTQFTYHI